MLRSFQKRERASRALITPNGLRISPTTGTCRKAPLFHGLPYIVQQVAGTATGNIPGHHRCNGGRAPLP